MFGSKANGGEEKEEEEQEVEEVVALSNLARD